jgi:hypothetical protein
MLIADGFVALTGGIFENPNGPFFIFPPPSSETVEQAVKNKENIIIY